MLFLRGMLRFTLIALLAGCAHQQQPQNVWVKPNSGDQDFATDRYACERDARQSGHFGDGLIGMVQIQRYFNQCMNTHGWSLQDKELATLQADITQFRSQQVRQNDRDCVPKVRSAPKFQPIASHFSDLKNGKYGFAEMSDPRTPTPEEANLLRDYFIGVESCSAAAMADALPLLSVQQAQAMKAQNDNHAALQAQFVRRQMSWGEYATRSNQLGI